MSTSVINKDLKSYINTDVFIYHLNIPTYEKLESMLEKTTYTSTIKSISTKLDTLMKVPHQEFWCHIIYDTSILKSLQSYCNNILRPHELFLENIEWSNEEKELHKKYYMLILRVLSTKETKLAAFSNVTFGELIYENFIVDIPLLFDICSLYGEENQEIVSKMIIFVFSCQSLYINDFKLYASHTVKLFEENISQIISNSKEKRNLHIMSNEHSSEKSIHNLLYYIIDLGRSWSIMLSCLKTKSEIFSMLFEILFHKSLEKLFDKLVPFIQNKVDQFDLSDADKIKQLLSVACFQLIGVWRKIFNGKFLEKLNEKCFANSLRSSEENFQLISECVSAINSSQENPMFADAMYLMFPFQDDFQIISEAIKRDKDEYYSGFISETVKEIIKEIECRQTIFSSISVTDNLSNGFTSSKKSQNGEFLVAMEIFPDLTEHDIKAYLKCYNCTDENLIEAMLAGAIDIDFVKSVALRVNDEEQTSKAINRSYLANHGNIYDGDDLDTGRVSASQLHIGKRQTKLNEVVDQTLKNMILDIVTNQNEEDADNHEPFINDNHLTYEDEFDDVYGISHSGVVIDNKNVDDEKDIEEIRPSRNNKLGTEPGEKNLSKQDGAAIGDVDRKIPEEYMSKPKGSKYHQRQFKNKKFQDGPPRTPNGTFANHRMGSHAPKETTFKKDRRPKAERAKYTND